MLGFLSLMAYNTYICLIQNFEQMTFSELQDKIFANYEAGAISDEHLVQIIEQSAVYLNLKTQTNTAIFRGKSYNGIKNFTNHSIVIDGVKFYSNNE